MEPGQFNEFREQGILYDGMAATWAILFTPTHLDCIISRGAVTAMDARGRSMSECGAKIVKALGLPKNTIWFKMDFSLKGSPLIELECYTDDLDLNEQGDDLIRILKEYELKEIDPEAVQ